MGRHHALKPPHLCLSSPPQPSRASFLSVKNHVHSSSVSFFEGTSTTALAIGDRIPGLKVSAAFLSSLQSNIFIDIDSCPNSGTNTPDSLRPTNFQVPPSPLAFAISTAADEDFLIKKASLLPQLKMSTRNAHAHAESPLGANDFDDVPELTTFAATDTDTKVEALHLLADSVAQQRNMGSRTLIYSPVTIAALVAGFAFVRNFYTTNGDTDWTMVIMTFAGVIMLILAGIRKICSGYIDEAEKVGTWKWLNQGRSSEEQEENGIKMLGDDDEVLLTKFGDEYIGTIVFRGVQPISAKAGNDSPSSSSPNRKPRKARSNSFGQAKLQIRGWTVAQKYRRKGVGSALMDEALEIGKEKGWTAGGVEFANDHANHKRILPEVFNGAFKKMEQIAFKTLDARQRATKGSSGNQEKRKKK